MSKILVTGGAGYIGSHAVLALQSGGFEVAVLDDLSTGNRRNLPAGAIFYEGDIADDRLVDRIAIEQKIGCIMHFAGSIVVPDSVEQPLDYYLNNTVKSRALIASAVRNGIGHFIFSSTAAVYGHPVAVPIDEGSATSPINPYGASKLMTEWMLRDTAAAHPINFGCLRYFNVAGADPQGRSGQSSRTSTHLIKIAVEAAVGKRASVAVYGSDYDTSDGTGVRDYVHVSDLAEAHVLAMRYLIDNPEISITMNCGYNRGFSVLEVLDAVERVAGVRINRTMAPRRAGDPPALVSQNRAIVETLGWEPRYDDLDTIVAHALAWERKLGADAAAKAG